MNPHSMVARHRLKGILRLCQRYLKKDRLSRHDTVILARDHNNRSVQY